MLDALERPLTLNDLKRAAASFENAENV